MDASRVLPRILLMLLMLGLLAGVAPAQTSQPAPAPAPPGENLAAPPADSSQVFSEAWFNKTRNPVSWFKWGADLRARDEYFTNAITLNKDAVGHEQHFQRYRTRLWSTVTPVKDLDINSRLVWEFRNYCLPHGTQSGSLEGIRDVNFNEALFDNLNIKWSHILGQPATLTVGRQDIILGDGWLVLEGTPLDGSRTIYFDAARLNYNWEQAKTVLDLIYIQQYAQADKWIQPFNDQNKPLVEQDQRGAILHVANKSIKDTEIDGYFIYTQDYNADEYPGGVDADIYTFGGRYVRSFGEHWRYRAELAKQLGHKSMEDLCALGFNSRLAYFTNDSLNNNFRLSYEYLSGDDPDTDTNEAFDPLWGRWPQWSELYVFTYAPETSIASVTNLHRVGPGWSFNPTKQLEVCADYYLLFADQNPRGDQTGYSSDGKFRGQLVTAILRYTLNPHVKMHLLGEAFFPGNYYDDTKNDVAVFARYEVTFTW